MTLCCHPAPVSWFQINKNKLSEIMTPLLLSDAFNKKQDSHFARPLLAKISRESHLEYEAMQEAFQLLGWGDVADELKIEIYADIRAMVEELRGHYCSNDPYVQRRRESVCYWVENVRHGICSLQTAIQALKVRGL